MRRSISCRRRCLPGCSRSKCGCKAKRRDRLPSVIMRTHDVIVIGAGAAGLAAGRTLIDRGCKAIILEARDRVGGRAWTESASFGVPIDRGCGWLHSADENPWRAIARNLGIAVLEENPVWQGRIGDRWL